MLKLLPKPLLLFISAVLIIAATFWFWPTRPSSLAACQLPALPQQTFLLGDQSLRVAVASTPTEQAQGLSGCTHFHGLDGLLFPFAAPHRATFWLKDMHMPINIFWLRGGELIGSEHNLLPPSPGTPDELLVSYPSPELVDAVLETASGQSP
jgi:uncharacterized membrane protein (UPF0127 family)